MIINNNIYKILKTKDLIPTIILSVISTCVIYLLRGISDELIYLKFFNKKDDKEENKKNLVLKNIIRTIVSMIFLSWIINFNNK